MDQANSRTGREVKLREGLTDGDVELMRQAVASGDVREAQRIVESRGLVWITGEVGMSQIEQLAQAGVPVVCIE
ncbi:MAG: hypothetical protein M0P19_08875 [Nevskia sp.]|jgi:hypothetical protein|nr:hypothetical protein [Nevskia sp.]MCK9386102.1 hypothetical protein [Nevskia sp.]